MVSERDWKKISAHSLLRGIPRELVCRILNTEGGEIREFASGEAFGNGSRMGFLISGRALAQTADHSRHVLLRVLSSGDVFGVAGVFSPAADMSKISADKACRCLFFSESAVSKLLEISDAFRKNYVVFLSDRIRFLNQKILYLTAGSAERRLALYLLSLGHTEVELTDSISSLSELLNLGRASLYRAFDKLCEDGYLQKVGKKLILLNTEAMLQAYQ